MQQNNFEKFADYFAEADRVKNSWLIGTEKEGYAASRNHIWNRDRMNVYTSLPQPQHEGVSERGNVLWVMHGYRNSLIKCAHVHTVLLEGDSGFLESNGDCLLKTKYSRVGCGVKDHILPRKTPQNSGELLNLEVGQDWR